MGTGATPPSKRPPLRAVVLSTAQQDEVAVDLSMLLSSPLSPSPPPSSPTTRRGRRAWKVTRSAQGKYSGRAERIEYRRTLASLQGSSERQARAHTRTCLPSLV